MAELIRGLPEPLPEGERVLWQGAPRWQPLFVHAFHGRKLAFYFGAILLLRGAFSAADGASLAQAAISALWLLPLALAALGLFALIAVLTARTTIYAITDRRVVMRIGIVLAITINIPYRIVESASCRRYADGSGDLPLRLHAGDRLAWLHLWPHVRPWRVGHPEPMLRTVDDAEGIAALLGRALAESSGSTVRAAPETLPKPAADRGPLVPVAH